MAAAEKMNWIYEGVSGLVDKEEYLTGRKIDKTFEIARFEKDGGNVCDFSFQESNVPSLLESSTNNLSKLDLDIRLKEDPLQEIKRKQANIIKETLTNPIKMKRIKQLLEESLRKEKEEKRARRKLRKLKKKAKKLKKERKRSVSRSSADSVNGARGEHKRRADGELPVRIKRERKDYSSERSDNEKVRKHESKLGYSRESECKKNAASKHRIGKRDDFSKQSNNELAQVKQERRSSVNRDCSSYASQRYRSPRKRRESSDSCSSGSSVNYSSSASSRSSSVSSARSDEHRSRSKSIVRNSRNRRHSSSGSESRARRRNDKYSSDRRSSRDRKIEKYAGHQSSKDRYAERHGAKFDDRYHDRKPKDRLRERSRDRSFRDRSPRERSSAKMQVDDWPEDERDMIPVVRSPVSIDPLKFARPCGKERQEQKNRRLFESGQYSSGKADLNSLVDGLITSRYNTNFNQNQPKYNYYGPNDEYRNSKRQRPDQDDDSRSGHKKPSRGDDEREMEAKRKQMMSNAAWRESQRSKDVEMHVKEYEREAMEVQTSLNKNYSNRY